MGMSVCGGGGGGVTMLEEGGLCSGDCVGGRGAVFG